mgnify:FL=1
MKNRKLLSITVILCILVAFFAFFHLNSRERISAQCVQLTADNKNYEITLSDLSYEHVSGVRINGKGEEIPVEGQGIALSDLLKQYNVTDFGKITVISDDSYSAKVSADEVDKAFFLLEETELRLLVFGDKDSKRSVSNVKQIIAE